MIRVVHHLVLALGLVAGILSGTAAGPALAADPPWGVYDPAQPGSLRLRAFPLTRMPQPVEEAPAKSFKLYQSFTFANQPDGLDKCGLTRLPLLTPSLFFPGGKSTDRIDRAYVDQRLAKIEAMFTPKSGDIGIVNIEGAWSIKRTDAPAVVRQKVDRYLDVLDYLEDRLGGKYRFGVYGEAPLKDYFSYQTDYFGHPASVQYQDFIQAPALAAQVNLGIERLARRSDALFPPQYTLWYDDLGRTEAERWELTVQGWTVAARESLKVAKRWDRPVYPFVWMQYHNKINVPELANKFLPKGFFGYQLETLKKLGADGVVIWGTLGPDGTGRASFDRNADWWREFLAFARTNGADLSGCTLLPDR
ncbi:hyaluronidase [Geminicoccus harenae]|uniref:hyaluronidase n=2 Tax=Geminicoccus harenae TaxID=2498453 RepID=UPI001C957500|nr:hyaluronidase [Geminicoccus harenae]